MADSAPVEIGGLPVVHFTRIDKRHKATGRTKHWIAGELHSPFDALAICRDRDAKGYYLFYCDSTWQPITDTWHWSLEDAMHQAEFEYSGVSKSWQKPGEE